MQRYLYLLMEIADREFEGKFLLACHAVRKGWRVVICPRLYFFDNIVKFPPGTVIYKSITPTDLALIEKIKRQGNHFVCIDEEGIVQREEAFRSKVMYDDRCLEVIDRLFLLNQRQKELLLSYNSVDANKLSVTGYPRLEFLKLLRDTNDNKIVLSLKKKYKRFIFLPTSFAYSNPIQGHFGLSYNFNNTVQNLTPERQELFNGIKAIANYMQKEYENLIQQISDAFPHINIVLRPHPSEDSNYWIKKFKHRENIIVDYQYPAFYYIKASELVIQYGSTIGIESNVLGKACLQYDPELPKEIEPYTVKETQLYVTSFNSTTSVITQIDNIVNNNEKPVFDSRYKVPRKAAEQIVDILNKRFSDLSKMKKIHFPVQMLSQGYRRYLRYMILWTAAKTNLLGLLPQRYFTGKYRLLRKESRKFHLNAFQYIERKNGKVTQDRVDESLKMLHALWPESPNNIRVKRKAFNVFDITCD